MKKLFSVLIVFISISFSMFAVDINFDDFTEGMTKKEVEKTIKSKKLKYEKLNKDWYEVLYTDYKGVPVKYVEFYFKDDKLNKFSITFDKDTEQELFLPLVTDWLNYYEIDKDNNYKYSTSFRIYLLYSYSLDNRLLAYYYINRDTLDYTFSIEVK